jgi:isopentenyl-diphosphate delta-isomerase
MTVVGSGGIRSGLDVAKVIALGADAAGMAAPFLEPATVGSSAVRAKLEELVTELRIAMFCVGITDVEQLRDTPLLRDTE